jgi:hypothetical protein
MGIAWAFFGFTVFFPTIKKVLTNYPFNSVHWCPWTLFLV